MNKRYATVVISTFFILGLTLGSPTFAAEDAKEKRAEVDGMCKDTLSDLYKKTPEAKKQIQQSQGYGCFSNFGISFIVGGAGGSGVVYDNKTKKTTYMKVGQASIGLNISAREYREVLIFNDRESLEHFIQSGWEPTASITASAASEGSGTSNERTKSGYSNITIYSLTESGATLGGSGAGRKYWRDDELNSKDR